MHRSAIVAVALACAAMPAIARADATVTPTASPLTDRVDSILNEAYVPTINDPDVILSPCPYRGDTFGCTLAAKDSPVWITPSLLSPYALLHELGHRYQFDVMTASGLRRFAAIMRIRRWTGGTTELFADAYASCALGWEPRRRPNVDNVDDHFPTGEGYWPTRHQQDRVCDLIARADP